jgi:hypothetical protein
MLERRGRKVNNVQPRLITNKTARRQVAAPDAASAQAADNIVNPDTTGGITVRAR